MKATSSHRVLAGSPGAVAALQGSALRRNAFRAGQASPRRILVVVTRQIGDVLLTTPLIRDMRLLWPDASIDVLGFANTLGMLDGNPDVRQRIEVPAGASTTARLAFARSLWRAYDLAVVTEHSDRAHLYGFLAARVRVGMVPERAKHAWWKRLLLHHAVTRAGDLGAVRVVDEKRRLLDPWRSGAFLAPGAAVPPADQPLPTALQARLRPGYVVVHVPSMWNYKQWPVAHYRRLIEGLVGAQRQVVLTGSGAPADRAKIVDAAGSGGVADVVDASGLAFGQLASLLRSASLYVGPDASVTHLAAALGGPVLTLFGPTNPMRWGPVGPSTDGSPWQTENASAQRRAPIVMLQGSQPCVPCGKAGCADHRDSASACLEGIDPARVLARALDMLKA